MANISESMDKLEACHRILVAACEFKNVLVARSSTFSHPVCQDEALGLLMKSTLSATDAILASCSYIPKSDIRGFEMDPNPPYCIRRGSYVVPQPAPESPAKDHLTTPHRCSEDACQDPLTGNYQPHYNEALPKDPRGVWEQLRKESEDCSNPFIGLDILGRVKKESETGSCQEPLAAPERIRQPEPPEFLSGFSKINTPPEWKGHYGGIYPAPTYVCIGDQNLGSGPSESNIGYWVRADNV